MPRPRKDLGKLKYVIAISVVVVVVLLDQLSKDWVLRTLQPEEVRAVIPNFFNLTLVYNTGIIFGWMPGQVHWIVWLYPVLLGLILYVYASHGFIHAGRIEQVALGMLIGGAIGNLIDRLRWDYVVDFLDFYIKDHHWWAFNVADSCLSVSVVILFIVSLFRVEGVEPKSE